jgi:hypothetical protein
MTIVDNDHALPEGLGFRLALDMPAMTNFVNMPDNQKNKMVDYIKSSASGEEARNRVTEVINRLHQGDSFQ